MPSCPYNFVPLNDRIVPSELKESDLSSAALFKSYDKDKLSGRIDLTITCLSDTFIRGVGSDFLKINGKPILPGSSIRGMIRNIVSILSWSRINTKDKKLFFRSVYADKGKQTSDVDYYQEIFLNKTELVSSKVKAGYLKKKGDTFIIIKAEEINEATFHRYDRISPTGHKDEFWLTKDNHPIWHFDPNNCKKVHSSKNAYLEYNIAKSVIDHERDGFRKALVISGGNMKKYKDSNRKELGMELIRHFNYLIHEMLNEKEKKNYSVIPHDVIRDYEDDRSRNIRKGFDPLERAKNESISPCFYLVDEQLEKVIAFGHTPFFRLPAKKSTQDGIPEYSTKKGDLDFVSAIFGTAADQKQAFGGRVFFSDAVVQEYTQKIPQKLKVLSEPKPTAFKHYLKQPTATNNSKSFVTWNHVDVRIRGHKLYWNHQNSQPYQNSEPNLAKNKSYDAQIDNLKIQSDPIQPVDVKSVFKSFIFFTNLSKTELGLLQWALHLNGEQTTHRLGMGKPYGMGKVSIEASTSIKIVSNNLKDIFISDGNVTYSQLQHKSYIENFTDYIKDEKRSGLSSILVKEWENSCRILWKLLDKVGKSEDDVKYMSHKEHSIPIALPFIKIP